MHKQKKFFDTNSFGYNILNLYEKINTDIENNKSFANPCKKGCSDCCKQFFVISPMEFYTILRTLYKEKGYTSVKDVLKKGYVQFKILEETNPDLAKMLATGITTKDVRSQEELFKSLNILLKSSSMVDELNDYCLFLDEDTSSCSIYEYRPLICRCHGVGFLDKENIGLPCDVSNIDTFNANNLIDFSYVHDENLKLTIIESNKYNTACIDRPMPILYFCKFLYETDDDFILNKIDIAGNLSKEDYVNEKIEKILRKQGLL